MQLEENYESAQGFGVDVVNARPRQALVIDTKTVGYPRAFSPTSTPATTPSRPSSTSTSSSTSPPAKPLAAARQGRRPALEPEARQPLQRAGQAPHRPQIHTPSKLTLDKVIPPIEGTDAGSRRHGRRTRPTSKWLKYIRFRSEKLSKFWGRDMYLGAWVLLPDGFDEHPDAHYPLVVYQDHFHAGFGARCPSSRPNPSRGSNGSHTQPMTATSSSRTGPPAVCRASSCSTSRTPTPTTTTATT